MGRLFLAAEVASQPPLGGGRSLLCLNCQVRLEEAGLTTAISTAGGEIQKTLSATWSSS